MVEYFFIVESGEIDSKNAIGVEGTSRGSKLKVSEWNGNDKQLWRWTDDGNLESKYSELVIDVKGKKSKEGTEVHMWRKHGEMNQKWQIENGMIKSRIGEELYITKLIDNCLAVWHVGNYIQKWRLIPEAKWNAYELYLLNQNPLMKVMFLKSVLSEHMECVLGCTIKQYEQYLKDCVSVGNACATKLDEVTKDVGIAKATGGGVAIAGGTASLVGLALAPFTAGLSLGLTVGGAIAAGAGGLTSLGAAITDHCYNKDEMKNVKPIIDMTVRVSTGLRSMIFEICKETEEAVKFLETPEGKSFVEEIRFFRRKSKKIVKKAVSMWNAGKKGVDAARAIKEMKGLAAFIEADYYAVKAAMTGTAEFAAAPGLKMPLTGKVLLQGGSAGAKAFSGALSVLGIVFGIMDVVSGAKAIQEGSPIAKELRKSATQIDKQGKELITTYNELFK